MHNMSTNLGVHKSTSFPFRAETDPWTRIQSQIKLIQIHSDTSTQYQLLTKRRATAKTVIAQHHVGREQSTFSKKITNLDSALNFSALTRLVGRQ